LAEDQPTVRGRDLQILLARRDATTGAGTGQGTRQQLILDIEQQLGSIHFAGALAARGNR
jgi:hypothetical protein